MKKKGYKTVSVAQREGGFAVLLDETVALTPRSKPLVLPTHALARAVAEEWRAQKPKFDPKQMPLTRLANTAIDLDDRDALVARLLNYSGTDLLLYRGEEPPLAERQQNEWEPLLGWMHDRFGVGFIVSTGVMHLDQPRETVERLRSFLAGLDPFVLTGLLSVTTVLTSLVLALAIAEGRLSAEAAFALSQLDERYQAERWGLDRAAELRAEAMAGDLQLAAEFLALSRT